MRFTSGNESWSRDAVIISDTSKEIKEDIETGFVLNKNYTVAVTVIMDHGNITSSADFSEMFWCVHTCNSYQNLPIVFFQVFCTRMCQQ